MAKYGSKDVAIFIKDGVDGAGDYKEVSVDILDFPGIDLQAKTEEGHGFSEEYARQVATGLMEYPDVTLRGFYDDTALTGTHVLFNRIGSETDFKVTWHSGEDEEFRALIKGYKRLPTRGELTKFEVTLALRPIPA